MGEHKHTPGPWRWEINLQTKHINLCGGRPPYDLHVMDFVRWGMAGASPRFNTDHGGLMLMTRADEMTVVDSGREHHASWHRLINHPDANLIASAPDLLTALEGLMWRFEDDDEDPHCESKVAPDIAAARAAIARAKGVANG